jgi:hypothetical protein
MPFDDEFAINVEEEFQAPILVRAGFVCACHWSLADCRFSLAGRLLMRRQTGGGQWRTTDDKRQWRLPDADTGAKDEQVDKRNSGLCIAGRGLVDSCEGTPPGNRAGPHRG